MPAYFDRGILTASTWHNLNEIGALPDAPSMIDEGERTGAWPVSVQSLVPSVTLDDGRVVNGENWKAIAATYRNHEPRMLGVNGSRYTATTPEAWRDLVTAATAAGAAPTGAFSLRDGRKVLATFEVADQSGIKTQLILADSFDGSTRLMAGFTSIRVVCANTLAAAMNQSGDDWAKIRHTATLEEKVARLGKGISEAVKRGSQVVDTFEKASRMYLSREQAVAAFDALFPPAKEDASQRAKTKAERVRNEARVAAGMSINKVGDHPGNLATLWNAATYLVDRRPDGSTRDARGGGRDTMIDSMLFGSRANRIEEIRHLVKVIMADGSVQEMSVPEATAAGVETGQLGASILSEMLAEV